MRRSSPVLVAVLAAAFLLSACGSGLGSPPAAKVGSQTVTRSQLDQDLEVLADNRDWLKSIGSQLGSDAEQPNGNVSTAFTAAWLTALMNQAVIDEAFEQRGLEVTDADRQAAQNAGRTLFETQQGGTWNTLPKSFRARFVDRQSRYEALADVLPDPPPTDAQLQAILERVRPTVCESGEAVAHILVPTREAADQIEAALARGEDFTTLAEQSTDTGTSAIGGFLTCKGSQYVSQLPAPLQQAITDTPLGTISAPVQTDLGFHVVKVMPFEVANARLYLLRLRQQIVTTPINKFIDRRLRAVGVWVDPRYGRLAKSTIRVVAPQAPKVQSKPPSP